MTSGTAQQILRDTFGYTSFRGAQQAIVEHLVAGGDALVLMPTGVGFYYVDDSVACRSVYISGVIVDFSKPTRLGRKNVIQLTYELAGIPAIFAFAK
ncbi:MAG: hypothetical protein A2100_04805 [Sideroxydans sp. GWF2_59_14]|nr:MAG: hypothetical protein A2100_04805 [Sideroxydans sp. GWF2_59_14]HAF45395.1 hypothetical protein [Gallionellaceae bacterium]